jgi:hypothetical protein
LDADERGRRPISKLDHVDQNPYNKKERETPAKTPKTEQE